MTVFLVLLACGEKETDTAVAEDTAVESDTGESTEGSEGTGETGGTEETDTQETGDPDPGSSTWGSDTVWDLSTGGGCGDYFLYLHNDADTLALQISGNGLAMEAHQSARGVVEHSYVINPMTDEVQPLIVAQEGSNLNAWSCNDASIYNPEVSAQYVAMSGAVDVTVVAEGEMTDWGEVPANMSMVLSNVCFEAPEPFCIEELVIEQYIGWMPG